MNYGQYESQTKAQIIARVPDWNVFRDGSPGGESPAEITARADRLAARLKGLGGNILCFGHGHILRILASRWIGHPIVLAERLLLYTGNFSILSFDHDDAGEPAIKMWNCSGV